MTVLMEHLLSLRNISQSPCRWAVPSARPDARHALEEVIEAGRILEAQLSGCFLVGFAFATEKHCAPELEFVHPRTGVAFESRQKDATQLLASHRAPRRQVIDPVARAFREGNPIRGSVRPTSHVSKCSGFSVIPSSIRAMWSGSFRKSEKALQVEESHREPLKCTCGEARVGAIRNRCLFGTFVTSYNTRLPHAGSPT